MNQNKAKQFNYLDYACTLITYECRCTYMCVSSANYQEIS